MGMFPPAAEATLSILPVLNEAYKKVPFPKRVSIAIEQSSEPVFVSWCLQGGEIQEKWLNTSEDRKGFAQKILDEKWVFTKVDQFVYNGRKAIDFWIITQHSAKPPKHTQN